MDLGSVSKDCVTETILSKLSRTFYTSLPASYTGNIVAEVVSKIGVDFAGVKDVYQVKVYFPTKLYFLGHDSHLIDYVSYGMFLIC